MVLWLALAAPCALRLRLLHEGVELQQAVRRPGEAGCRLLSAGRHLHFVLLDIRLSAPLPAGCWIDYTLELAPFDDPQAPWRPLSDWAPQLCYPGRASPGFMFVPEVATLLHGSCRKPHHPGGDGLAEADRLLAQCLAAEEGAPAWPSALVLSGDQIYADDVAGPMLAAIHALGQRLGLPDEAFATLQLPDLPDAAALRAHPDGFYRREQLLPRHKPHSTLADVLFGGVEKPVFTSDNAHNHLISLAEVLAMYLLVWSPLPWQGLTIGPPATLSDAERARYAEEEAALRSFVAALPAVQRVLAHLPVAMIFDDHDITDDWNLNREWEEIAYGHPFSRRVIGNALIGYLIAQGWGNQPESFDDALLDALQVALASPGSAAHDRVIDQLLSFGRWHYDWPTSPPLVVIDSRTHRWRSERSARRPSGLLDWESLQALQQRLFGHQAVLLVSPAPIFGVKLIEAVQRIFTWIGRPLMVDAENWMAHPGSAQGILGLFRDPRTPRHFVVLSGDVHYSFVYDVELREATQDARHGAHSGPTIWQICCSGLRNEFPPRLLDVLDRANRWLYSPRSPLNWLTRRRSMRVVPRKPEGTPHGRRLLNGSGLGVVELSADGRPWRISVWLAGGRVVRFVEREAEARWE